MVVQENFFTIKLGPEADISIKVAHLVIESWRKDDFDRTKMVEAVNKKLS